MKFSLCFSSFIYLGIASATLLDLSTSASSAAKNLLKNIQFDYIVVGGGTAGLAVARRLSDDGKSLVLVLEAGRSGVNDTLVTVPERSFSFIGTDIDWFYSTQPQAHGGNREINLSSGKVLGGDSAVNGLVWTYPHKADWDDFENLGSPGWNFNNMYSAVKQAERVNIPAPQFSREFGYSIVPASHGRNGPVDTAFPPFVPLQHLRLLNASLELGHNFNLDPYTGHNNGAFFGLSSQNAQSSRTTSEFAYLDPVISRPNLIVLSHALVTVINTSSGRSAQLNDTDTDGFSQTVTSTGVQVRFPDGSVSAAKTKSSGEVILSAGTVRTPQLLELSGIGNTTILQKLGIPVKVNLPGVGENYEDHTLTILTYKLKPGFLSFDALGYNDTLRAEQQHLYDTQRLGMLTFAQASFNFASAQSILNATEFAEAQQILKTKPPSTPQDSFDLIKKKIANGVPQVEYILFNSFSGGLVKEPNTSYVSMAVTHLHPLSRGSIHINTASIDDHPIIDPNVLEAEWDNWFLAKATAYGRRFFETKAYADLVDPDEVFPGLQTQTLDDFKQFIAANINIGYHTVGTASLLPKAKQGVVDPNLRVYGTSNIRVVDNSIMPLLVSAHTQTTAYAIAERAAGIIKST